MNKRSYYDVAMNDYEHFNWLIQSKDLAHTRNPITIQAQQIVEKLLKYVLEEIACNEDNTELLRQRKIRSLGAAVKDQVGVTVISADDARFLTEFYFDARYPGENYIEATAEDVDRAIQVTKSVVESVQSIRRSKVDEAAQVDLQTLNEFSK